MKCYIKNKQSFDNIEVGIKTFEGRLYYGVWQNIQIGEVIIFVHKNQECSKIITKIVLYNTITEFCEYKRIPEYKTVFDLCYSLDRQEKYKVIILNFSE